ncbi:MAG: prolyl oligopeptidase family serine peptidase [Planctomycetota bacterium]
MREIRYLSSADSTEQPALLYVPRKKGRIPLLVALHPWSSTYSENCYEECAAWCAAKKWAFFHPDFRGKNDHPEATGSEFAIQDILSGVAFVREKADIDPARIYCMGASGGGHASLLMAGRAPELWADVSAWVPISDLVTWHARGGHYAPLIEASCGGAPGKSPAVDLEYRRRSPVTYLNPSLRVRIDVNASIYDGHQGSVPIDQSLRAFNLLADPKDRISSEDIRYFVEMAEVPPSLQASIWDPLYGEKRVLFRRVSGRARITLFQGAHECIQKAAMAWLAMQRRQ